MPQLPAYDGPQVAARGPQFDQASADSFGAIQGRQAQQLGRGVSDVGGVMLDEAQRARERDATSEVLATEARTKDAYRTWSADQMVKRQGAAAKGVTQDATNWWQKAQDEALKGTSDPMVQRALTRALQAQRAASLDHFSGFENQQLEASLQQDVQASVDKSVSLAAQAPVQGNIDLQLNAIKGALTAYGSTRWTPEVLQEKITKATYALNKGVFDNLLVASPTGAQAYFLKNRDNFNPLQYDEIETKLKATTAAEIGGNQGRAIFQSFMSGKPLSAPIPSTEIDAKLVEAAGGKPEVLAAMRAEVQHQTGLFNKSQSEFTAAAASKVADALYKPGATLANVQRLPEWNQLTGQQREAFVEHYTDRQHMLYARSIQDKMLAQQALDLKLAPAMLEMSRPDYLSAVTPDVIMGMVPTIGPANVATLLQRKQQFDTNKTKLSEAKVDNDSFDAIMAAAGLDPKPKATEKDAALIAWRTRQDVENAIGAQQAAKGRELTRSEKDEVMKGIIHAKVLMPSWGGMGTSEEFVAGQDPAKVAAKGAVSIPTTDAAGKPSVMKLNLASIPVNDYADLVRARTQKGLPTDPTSVAQEWWVRRGSKGKK